MSDLQIVLIVIGGMIIAGVLIFNWWQERKFHQQIDQNFSKFEPEQGSAVDASTATVLPEQETTPAQEAQEFTIDPHRFLDHATSVYVADPLQEVDTAPAIAQEENQPEAEMKIEVEEPFAKSEQPSEQHHEIKAIIQHAFEQVSPAQAADAPTVPAPIASPFPSMLNSQVDWAALLYLEGAATVQNVQAALKDGFSQYDKPVFVHVQTEQGWLLLSEIAEKAEYAQLPVAKISCSIQLADRAGPITRSVLNRFQLAVESLGLDMNAHVTWQNSGDALNEANALDQFCIEVDKTMGFHLLHGENGAFTGTKLRGLAEAQGMTLESDGTFKLFDDSNKNPNMNNPNTMMHESHLLQPRFVMFNRDQNPFNADMLRSSVIKSVTFQLDIPHAQNCVDAFNHMVQVAKQMETGLNAQLVDDNNRPLTDAQIEKIRHQLKIIQATMLTRGITPGSDCARRLFS